MNITFSYGICAALMVIQDLGWCGGVGFEPNWVQIKFWQEGSWGLVVIAVSEGGNNQARSYGFRRGTSFCKNAENLGSPPRRSDHKGSLASNSGRTPSLSS